jgi:hypothetical protein
MYSEIAAKESCTSTASTIAPPDAVIRPQRTLDQPRRGGDHARLDSPGMPPGPPSVATQQGARHVPEEIVRRLVLPLWCRDTSPRFVWWHHDLPCETSQSQEPHHEADRAACHQLVPRWRDGTRVHEARP